MTTREDILRLADQLPSGRRDPKAVTKFRAEMREFEDEIKAGRRSDAATELADLVYYWCKMPFLERILHHKAVKRATRALEVSWSTAFQLAEAKYSLRARAGNPKDKEAEREACAVVIR